MYTPSCKSAKSVILWKPGPDTNLVVLTKTDWHGVWAGATGSMYHPNMGYGTGQVEIYHCAYIPKWCQYSDFDQQKTDLRSWYQNEITKSIGLKITYPTCWKSCALQWLETYHWYGIGTNTHIYGISVPFGRYLRGLWTQWSRIELLRSKMTNRTLVDLVNIPISSYLAYSLFWGIETMTSILSYLV